MACLPLSAAPSHSPPRLSLLVLIAASICPNGRSQAEHQNCLDLLHKETAGNPREVVCLAERILRRSDAENVPVGTSLVMCIVQEYRAMLKRLTRGYPRTR